MGHRSEGTVGLSSRLHGARSRHGVNHGDTQGDTGKAARSSDPPAPDNGLPSPNMPPLQENTDPDPGIFPLFPRRGTFPPEAPSTSPGCRPTTAPTAPWVPLCRKVGDPGDRAPGSGQEATEQPWMGARGEGGLPVCGHLTLTAYGDRGQHVFPALWADPVCGSTSWVSQARPALPTGAGPGELPQAQPESTYPRSWF